MSESPHIFVDVPQIDSQIAGLHRAYTELGSAIQMLSSSASTQLKGLHSDAKASFSTLADTHLPKQDIDQIETAIASQRSSEQAFQTSMRRIGNIPSVSVSRGGDTAKGKELDIADQIPDPGPTKEKAESAVEQSGSANQMLVKMQEGHALRKKKSVTWIEKEAKAVKKKIKELLSSIPAGVAGGFVAGLIGSMALGYTEMDRRRAEMSETANIFEGSVDTMYSAASKKATGWFAKWGERAQWQWGVGRKETQGALKVMVDNGIRSEELLEKYDDRLGAAGKNVGTLTLALGKHFNFSTTESAEGIVSLIKDYGMERKAATGFFVKLHGAGARSGIGVRNFTRIVMSATDPLARMGVNAESAGVVVDEILGYFDSMGLEKRYAGHQAQGVAVDLLTAFGKIDDQFKVLLMRDMDPSNEADAPGLIRQFKDGLERVSQGKGDTFIESLLGSYTKIVHQRSGFGRSANIRLHEQLLSINNPTAVLLEDVGGKFAKGGKLEDLEDDQRKGLRSAFRTESQQVSLLHKTRREMIRGMGQFGRGMLAVLVDLLSMIIIGVNGLRAMLLAEGRSDRADIYRKIYLEQLKAQRSLGKSWDEAWGGLKIAGTALGREFMDTFKPVIDVITADIRGEAAPEAQRPEMASGADVDPDTDSDVGDFEDDRDEDVDADRDTGATAGPTTTATAEEAQGDPEDMQLDSDADEGGSDASPPVRKREKRKNKLMGPGQSAEVTPPEAEFIIESSQVFKATTNLPMGYFDD